MSLKETELLAKRAAEQAEYEQKLDDIIATAKRQGVELTRRDVHYVLFMERKAAAVAAAEQRSTEAQRIVKKIVAHPLEAHRDVESWTRTDFIREVQQDQERGGHGGRRSLARRYTVSPSKLYRRWQAVASGEPWPSGQKGPPDRT